MLRPGVLASIFGSADLVPYAPLLAAVIVTWTVAAFLEVVPVAYQDLVASTLFIVGSQASKTIVFIVAARAGESVRALVAAGHPVRRSAMVVCCVGALRMSFFATISRYPRGNTRSVVYGR